jgi:hypothetical protein
MQIYEIIAALDEEIARLEQVRSLLSGASTSTTTQSTKKRTMSVEGRARIVAAQKARWAKSRKKKSS